MFDTCSSIDYEDNHPKSGISIDGQYLSIFSVSESYAGSNVYDSDCISTAISAPCRASYFDGLHASHSRLVSGVNEWL